MSIIYAVVVRQSQNEQVTLCSYDAAHGNYPTITEDILKFIKIVDKTSYKYNEQYNYHIVKDGALLFVCLADSSLKLKTAYVFLEQIKKRFKEKYSSAQIEQATSFEMSASFSEIFKQQFIFFNSNKDQDKEMVLAKHLEKLQGNLKENIQKVLQREEKVEMMVKKTQKTYTISEQIQEKASQANKKAFWAKHRCKVMGGVLIVAAIVSMIFIL